MQDRIGQYRLLERIAQGGMGEVYKAKLVRKAGFEKLVAIKRMLPFLARKEDFVRRFQQEARLAARLNHANIVHIYDFGQEDDSLFLAMEYLDGPDLSRLLGELKAQAIPFPTAHALRIVRDACKGLDYAHRLSDEQGQALGLVHGDISPGNILLDREGEVKLTDFGLAKVRRGEEVHEDRLAGKLCYLSPEQVRGEPQDRRSDVYSLGLVLFELLYGCKVFAPDDPRKAGEDSASLFARICSGAWTRPDDPTLPDEVIRILERSLSLEKAGRYDTALQMAQALNDALGRLPKPEQPLSWYVQQVHRASETGVVEIPERTIVAEKPIERPEKKGTLVAAKPFLLQDEVSSLSTDHDATTGTAGASSRRWVLLLSLLGFLGAFLAWIAWPGVPKAGPVTVTVTPPLAQVFLNGVLQAETRPLVLRGLRVDREAVLELQATGYQRLRHELSLQENEAQNVGLELKALSRKLILESDPPGAEVQFNGQRLTETTPLSLPDIPLSKPQTVTLRRTGYVPVTKEFLITEASEEPYLIRVALNSLLGTLVLHTEPKNALVFLEGRRLSGTSPFRVDKLVRGKEYRLRVGAKGYRAQSLPVVLKEGEETSVNLHLEAAPLRVRLRAMDGLTVASKGKPATGTLEFRHPTEPLLVTVGAAEGRLRLRLEVDERHEGQGRFSAKAKLGFNCGASWASITLPGREPFTTPKSGVMLREGSHSLRIRFGGSQKDYHLVLELTR